MANLGKGWVRADAGNTGSEKTHTVRVQAFAIMATSTTLGEFKAFVAATGYKTSTPLLVQVVTKPWPTPIVPVHGMA